MLMLFCNKDLFLIYLICCDHYSNNRLYKIVNKYSPRIGVVSYEPDPITLSP